MGSVFGSSGVGVGGGAGPERTAIIRSWGYTAAVQEYVFQLLRTLSREASYFGDCTSVTNVFVIARCEGGSRTSVLLFLFWFSWGVKNSAFMLLLCLLVQCSSSL